MPEESQELRAAGLKVTLPRVEILKILESASDEQRHLSAEEVYDELRSGGQNVGLATVYRVLTQFANAGLVTRHNFEAGRDGTSSSHSVFELDRGEHHDHMVCVDTGEVIEFHDDMIEERQRQIAAEHGFELADHSLVLYVRKGR